jgi:hypothetical protein
MARDPLWIPHPGGIRRRGLDVQNSVLRWAACNQGDTRKESIYLNDSGFTIASSNTAVATAAYGPKVPGVNAHPVHVTSVGPGKATLTATAANGKTAQLEVTVFAPTPLSISFKAVKSDNWTSTLTETKVQRLLKNLNYIYSYQGNFTFSMPRALGQVTIPGLPNIVPNDDIRNWGFYRDCSADMTVFYVKENDVLGVNFRDLIMMEDIQRVPFDEMTLAHEVGHRLGLRHPNPVLPSNLMNQTSVGDRHRMKIFLTRTQIETITNKANWKQTTNFDTAVCAVKTVLGM